MVSGLRQLFERSNPYTDRCRMENLMKYIDLHVHSSCSGGTFTPEELVSLAIDNDLVAFALTDHDTIDGIDQAVDAAKEKNIQVIPGVELSCEYKLNSGKKKEIHILGYGLDWKQQELCDTLKAIAAERDQRNRKMCKNLAEAGFPIDYNSLVERFGSKILTRAHFARYLVEKGAIPSIDAAFKKILAEDGPYFVIREYLTPQKGIELIKQAGGIAVLAHPLLYKMSVSEIRQLIEELKEYGIEGIEAMYSRNHGNDEAFVRKLAQEYDLFITGGSDFHGTNKPDIELGKGEGNLRIPVILLENLK